MIDTQSSSITYLDTAEFEGQWKAKELDTRLWNQGQFLLLFIDSNITQTSQSACHAYHKVCEMELVCLIDSVI